MFFYLLFSSCSLTLNPNRFEFLSLLNYSILLGELETEEYIILYPFILLLHILIIFPTSLVPPIFLKIMSEEVITKYSNFFINSVSHYYITQLWDYIVSSHWNLHFNSLFMRLNIAMILASFYSVINFWMWSLTNFLFV